MSTLPRSAYPPCMFCRAPIERPGSSLVLHEVTGFTKPRSAGGANHIIGRTETGRLVCANCAGRVLRGIGLDQDSLLDQEPLFDA